MLLVGALALMWCFPASSAAQVGTLSGPAVIDEDVSGTWSYSLPSEPPPGACPSGCGWADPWEITGWDWGDGTPENLSSFTQDHTFETPSDPYEVTITVSAQRMIHPGHWETRSDEYHTWQECVLDPPYPQTDISDTTVLVLDTTNPAANAIEIEPPLLAGTTGENLSDYITTPPPGGVPNPEYIVFTIRDNNPYAFSSGTHPSGTHDRDGKFKIVFHYTRFRGCLGEGSMEEKTIVFENWASADGIEIEEGEPADESSCTFKIHLDKLKLSAWLNPDTGAEEEASHCSLYFANSSKSYRRNNPEKHNRYWITVVDSSGNGESEDAGGNPPSRKPKRVNGKDDCIIIVSDNDRPNIYVRMEDVRGNIGSWVKERWDELFQQGLKEDGTVEEDQEGLWLPQFGFTYYDETVVPDFPREPTILPMSIYPTPFNCNFTFNGQYVDHLDQHHFGQIFVHLPEDNLVMRNVKVKFDIRIIDNVDGIVSQTDASDYYQFDKPKPNFLARMANFIKGFIQDIVHLFKFSLTFQEATPEDGTYELFFHTWDKGKDITGKAIDDYVLDRDGNQKLLRKLPFIKGGNSRTLRIKFKVPEKGIEFKEIKEVNTGY